MIDTAYLLGYFAMGAGACLLIVALWGVAVCYAVEYYKQTRALLDLDEAIREWKVNHPDKAKKYQESM